MSTEAIASTVADGSSVGIDLSAGGSIQVFTVGRLRIGERVSLERSSDEGSTWTPVRDSAYQGNVLNSIVESQTVAGPGYFRLVKTVTADPVAVFYD